MFPGPLDEALLGEARKRGLWSLQIVNMRDFAQDAYRSVDDEAFGGGPGMVLRPDVVGAAVEATLSELSHPRLVSLTPRGTLLQQHHLQTWAQEERPLVFLCGRYEGIDQRISDHFGCEEISLGDFILMGGEVAAMVAIEGSVRLLKGVLGNQDSLEQESFTSDLLEYPHYTRPRVWREHAVPEVLLSGHHARIRDWREKEAEKITRTRRPDLWTRFQSRGMKKEEGR